MPHKFFFHFLECQIAVKKLRFEPALMDLSRVQMVRVFDGIQASSKAPHKPFMPRHISTVALEGNRNLSAIFPSKQTRKPPSPRHDSAASEGIQTVIGGEATTKTKTRFLLEDRTGLSRIHCQQHVRLKKSNTAPLDRSHKKAHVLWHLD